MDLARLMTEETADLTAPPTLLHDVRQGGQQRRRRRRAALAATAVTALLAAGLGVTTLRSAPAPTRFAGPLFDGSTHGDLAGDKTYLDAVVSAWTRSHDTSANRSRGVFDDLRGAPRVVWAGTTPAGRAAVVAQDAYLHEHGDIQLDHEGVYQLLGFAGPAADGAPRIVADTYPAPEGLAETAWYVDEARTVVAALSVEGATVGLSAEWVYEPDGTARRNYAPMQLADGVGIASVPAGARPAVARLPYRTFTDAIAILGGPDRQGEPQRLPWTGVTLLNGAAKPTSRSGFPLLARLLGERRRGAAMQVRGGTWSVMATAEGHTVLVGELGLDDDPTRAYAVIDDSTVVDAGFVAPASALPVLVRLPDRLGYVVAHYGAGLSYLNVKGVWVDAGRDAALLPAATNRVRVTVPGQPPQTVDLAARQ
jgi:hypothetical protein